ncbi:GNAT family N-acetyltransferase [Pseudoduganella armeniaca]|uniref:GNAT family N-acetyltransferase n=1 Tax=Pseudoduganella armeniaca TaxID=2072590 RepID=UPI0026978F3B|nr:GNAT family N-acetyltransferase [Pseudoduganella armeniaca]
MNAAIEELHGDGVRAHAAALADVLHDCVTQGASVGFVPPFDVSAARRWWLGIAQQVDAGARTVFVARDEDGICGTVQLALAMPANGAHRAEVNKMLVHTRARRRGIAMQLMTAAEARARELGRTLLVLDTWTGSGAEHLYRQLGFAVCGPIPAFARLADGTLGATTVMYKLLAPRLAIEDAVPSSADAAALLGELSAALSALTGDSGNASFDVADVRDPRACFVLARVDGAAVGCGALRPLSPHVAEVKRMYARPGHAGVGAALLGHLEARAAALGYTELWLETRKVNVRAVRFYEKHGYRRIDNYGKYAGMDAAVCFGRRL